MQAASRGVDLGSSLLHPARIADPTESCGPTSAAAVKSPECQPCRPSDGVARCIRAGRQCVRRNPVAGIVSTRFNSDQQGTCCETESANNCRMSTSSRLSVRHLRLAAAIVSDVIQSHSGLR